MEFEAHNKTVRFGNEGSMFVTVENGDSLTEEKVGVDGSYSYVLKVQGSTEGRRRGSCGEFNKRSNDLFGFANEILSQQKQGVDVAPAKKALENLKRSVS